MAASNFLSYVVSIEYFIYLSILSVAGHNNVKSKRCWEKTLDQVIPTKELLKNVRIVTEQPMNNVPREPLKVRRALFQSNSSLNQGVQSPMLLKGSMKENSSKHPINDSSDTIHSSSSSRGNDNQDEISCVGSAIRYVLMTTTSYWSTRFVVLVAAQMRDDALFFVVNVYISE
ncbi:hypothetical protein Cgig2_030217 [Carnegiea gigantea]|uniref:Uncharacterized protein n=1 Tax=Carnegiea gigantea TaxID=171969 RepID=A0A9Q1JT38_9CARY|nr:hypothetical protein Cgig2_030217 [Carnegiea gigantea]